MTDQELIKYFGEELWKEIPGSAKNKIDLLWRKLVHEEKMREIIEVKIAELEKRLEKKGNVLDRTQGVETPGWL